MDKDKSIFSSELYVLIVGMAAPMIASATGIPVTPAMVTATLAGVWAVCRTGYKIVKIIKEKKKDKTPMTGVPGIS